MNGTSHAERRPSWALGAIGTLSVTLALLVGGAGSAAAEGDRSAGHGHRGHAQNVILFVGDGLGVAQRDAGALYGRGLDGSLVMDTLPYAGLVETDSADPEEFVTDSAAAATAYAAGIKTYNGAISMDLANNPVETLVERAEKAGMATGLVTTGQVTDATPAAFGSHVEDRYEQTEVARQFIEETKVDVLLGGGEDYWYPEGDEGAFPDAPAEDPDEGSRSDQGNLVERAEELGYEYVNNAETLANADGHQLLGLFANQEMFQQRTEEEGAVYDPAVPLEEMARKALDVLAGHEDGFFLLVEEEAIDEMAHRNNAEHTMKAVLEFDEAVAVGRDFARKHRDTLLITVGDHETGGMAVEGVDDEDESGDDASAEDGPFDVADSEYQFFVDWTTSGHTNADVPLTAMGPGARELTGVFENTHVHHVMAEALFRLREH